MKVKNLKGTGECACRCGSWLRHWQRYTGADVPKYCPEEKCLKTELVGAHVKKDDSTDDNHYIIPLCDKHNLATEILTVADWCKLAPANVQKTCG